MARRNTERVRRRKPRTETHEIVKKGIALRDLAPPDEYAHPATLDDESGVVSHQDSIRWEGEKTIRMAYAACADLGADDRGLARLFGVSRETIKTWKRRYPAFLKAIHDGKDWFDREIVEKSLLSRCVGFEYEEVSHEVGIGANGPIDKVKTTRKKVLPDTLSLIFWLKNRHPDRWRDVKEVKGSGKIDVIHRPGKALADDPYLDLEKLDTKELEQMEGLMRKALKAGEDGKPPAPALEVVEDAEEAPSIPRDVGPEGEDN